MDEHERVWIQGDLSFWEHDYIALLQVNQGTAALGWPIGLPPGRPIYWLCADHEHATTWYPNMNGALIVGCMEGPCDVDVKIGTPGVGACFKYNSTALVTPTLSFFRGDNDQCHWDSLCAKPIGG